MTTIASAVIHARFWRTRQFISQTNIVKVVMCRIDGLLLDRAVNKAGVVYLALRDFLRVFFKSRSLGLIL